jgi:hypothetical protein
MSGFDCLLIERFLMNDVLLFGGLFAGIVALIVAFGVYSVYGGVHASLSHARVGEVYNFEYEQPLHGEPERYLAKVVEPVYSLTPEQIQRLNSRSRYRANDPQFVRTSHLVTCQTPDGSIRQFYAERAKNCRRPLLAGTLFKAGVAHLF